MDHMLIFQKRLNGILVAFKTEEQIAGWSAACN